MISGLNISIQKANNNSTYRRINTNKQVLKINRNCTTDTVSFQGMNTPAFKLLTKFYHFSVPRIAKMGLPLTPFDTPEIIVARMAHARLRQKPTYLLHTPERLRMREEIADKVYGSGAKLKQRISFIVIGHAGSGKTTKFAKPLLEKFGAFEVESDTVRHLLPEYKGGVGSYSVSREAIGIAQEIMDKAIANGDNIVHTRLGIHFDDVEACIKKLKSNGYKVHFRLVDVPAKVAAKRVVDRLKITGRFTDPILHFLYPNKPRQTYNLISHKCGSMLEDFAMYSNDVGRTEPPVLVRVASSL